MDRVQFLHSINHVNNTTVIDILMHFFDYFMIAYNLAANIIAVNLLRHDHNIIFQFCYSTKQSAEDSYFKLLNTPAIEIYQKIYTIQVDVVDDCTINVTISR